MTGSPGGWSLFLHFLCITTRALPTPRTPAYSKIYEQTLLGLGSTPILDPCTCHRLTPPCLAQATTSHPWTPVRTSCLLSTPSHPPGCTKDLRDLAITTLPPQPSLPRRDLCKKASPSSRLVLSSRIPSSDGTSPTPPYMAPAPHPCRSHPI